MELGGKSPCIVFADADLDAALDSALFGVFSLNGERCTAGSRILVERSIYDEFVERLAERASAIRVGDPADPATELGALISTEHYERVMSYVESGVDEGARLVAGGGRPDHLATGNYLAATVFADVTPQMRIFQRGDLRPGRVRHAVRRRGRGDRARQRHPVRPRRLRLDQRPAARPPGRPADRRRDGVAQLAQRPRPAHAVRRRQGERRSAARAASTASTSTPRSSIVHVALGDTHVPRFGVAHDRSQVTEADSRTSSAPPTSS